MEFVIPAVLRLLLSLAILRKPFWGMVFAVVIDAVDFDLIGLTNLLITGNNYVHYPIYMVVDKSLDLYIGILGLMVARSWAPLIYRTVIVLVCWRVIGVALYLMLGQRQVLLFFPNLFDFFFLFYAFADQYMPELRPQTARQLIAILIILLIPKLIQEYYLHILNSKLLLEFKHNFFRSVWAK